MRSKVLYIAITMGFLSPLCATEREANNSIYQPSIYEGWELVEYSPLSQLQPVEENKEEDWEIKAKAAANTAVVLMEGAAMTIGAIGISVIAQTIYSPFIQFNRGANQGARMVGRIYGQGVALDHIYEAEKNRIRNHPQ
jgi:hypothetical protein